MLKRRNAEERGHADHGWLNSYHTFSFADYYDPEHSGFRELLVINEDRVQPGRGFGSHPHRDMEIISFVIEGALEHKDSMGNSSIIVPGEIQRMTAGTGVVHSEFNSSDRDLVHFLQIWIKPGQQGLSPGYDQKRYSERIKPGELTLIASQNGLEDSVLIHQDVNIYLAKLEEGDSLDYSMGLQRHVWIQMIQGGVDLNGIPLEISDGLAASDESLLKITAKQSSQLLLFDLG
ncbi:MAG: pirin family protein [SAR324 cluster bacterium]|nr:pirin family protein [SAR324 cluster bacterium]